MAVVEAFSGSETVSTTEWSMVNDSSTIAANTTAGCYQLFIDVSAMAAGDEFQIRCYEKTRSADTQRVAWQANIVGVQATPIWVSPALMLLNGFDFTIDKVSGADRVFTWSIRKAG